MFGSLMMPMVRVLQVMRRVLLSLVMPTVRVLLMMVLLLPTAGDFQVLVLPVGPRMGCHRLFRAWALATPARKPGLRCWLVSLPVLAVLVASGVGAAPRHSWRRVPLAMLMVRVVQVMVLWMSVAWALQVLYRWMPRVRAL